MRHWAALVFVLGCATTANAQSGRRALAAGGEHYLVADYSGAAPLLARGLDPRAGPLDEAWKQGVQRLADVLLVLRDDSLAATWLRWACRLSLDFEANEDVAPPVVVRAVRAARAYVESTPRDPFVADVEFHWSRAPDSNAAATVRLGAARIPITARVGADQFLRGADSRHLPPGSYEVVVSAPGYLPTRLTVELLPGVETLIRVSLLPETAGALSVAARPWGTVSIDGARIGYTSVAAHRVAPGSHVIRLTRDREPPRDTTVVFNAHQQVRLSWVERRDTTGSGSVDSAFGRLDAGEIERGVEALGDALAPGRPSLRRPVRAHALMRLADAMWSLGARDSARAYLREAIHADPFYSPPSDVFNPDIVAAYDRERRAAVVIGVSGPKDTVLVPLHDTLPIAIAVGRPGEVRLLLRLGVPRPHDSVLAVLPVDSVTIARVALVSTSGRMLPPGAYAIEGQLAAAGSGASALLQLTLERTSVDTNPGASPIPPSMFRPATRKTGVSLRAVRTGVGLGALAVLLSTAVNSKTLSGRSIPPAAVVIGGSITLATVALERPTVADPENVSYNDSLRVAWDTRNRRIAAENAARRAGAPLRIRTAREP